MSATAEADRRQFFRVEDEVYLRYRVVTEQERLRITHEIRAGVRSAGQLLHDLEHNEELRSLRLAVAHSDSAVADYLQVLEQKILDLARVIAGETVSDSEMRHCEVSLSGGGVAFAADEAVPMNTVLEVWLSFPPRNRGVRALVKVVELGAAPDGGGMRLGTEFTVIDAADRDLVVSRVLARQAELLRASRRGGRRTD